MRHIEEIVSIGGKNYPVAAAVMREIKILLKKAGSQPIRDHRDWMPATQVFPELEDSVLGPALYLRGIRRREGLTQKQLAETTGMRQTHISEMEHGKRAISKQSAKKLAIALRTHWKHFL